MFETQVYRDPQMAQHQISPRFVRSNLKAYHHSSSYCIRLLWTSNEKNLIFLIWKFFPDLLKSWVKWLKYCQHDRADIKISSHLKIIQIKHLSDSWLTFGGECLLTIWPQSKRQNISQHQIQSSGNLPIMTKNHQNSNMVTCY